MPSSYDCSIEIHKSTPCGIAWVREGLGLKAPLVRNGTYPDREYLTRKIFKHIQSKNGRIGTLQRALESARLAGQNKYKNVAELLLWRQAGGGRWSFGVSGSVVAQGLDYGGGRSPRPVSFRFRSDAVPWSRPAGPAQRSHLPLPASPYPPWSNFLPSYLLNPQSSTFSRLFSCFTPELRLAGHPRQSTTRQPGGTISGQILLSYPKLGRF